MYKGIEQQFS